MSGSVGIMERGRNDYLASILPYTGEARKLAIDMRLIDPAYTLSDNQKILQVVDNVEWIYRDGAEDKATQMIFSDIGTPKSKEEGFDVYNELKALLVDRGIPKKKLPLSMMPILMKRKTHCLERSIAEKYGFSWLRLKKVERV